MWNAERGTHNVEYGKWNLKCENGIQKKLLNRLPVKMKGLDRRDFLSFLSSLSLRLTNHGIILEDYYLTF